MHQIEPKLAEWHRLYKELEQARERLSAAQRQSPMDRALIRQLQERVVDLRARSDDALVAIYSEMERLKRQQPRLVESSAWSNVTSEPRY